MRMRSVLFAAWLTLGFVLAVPAVVAQDGDSARTIAVSATDTVRVTPDRAIVRFAIVTRGQDAEAVRQENEQISQRVLNAVRERGIPERHIQVRVLQITESRQGRGSRRELAARREVEVIVDELVRLPAVVARVVQEGAAEFRGVTYALQNRQAHEDRVIVRASERARQKADLMASTLGATILGVRSVTETDAVPPPVGAPLHGFRAAAEAVTIATHEAFAPGEIEIRSSLRVVFEIE